MSQFDRRTGVKHLRVRRMKAIRFCAFLKATGINILRTAAFENRKNVGNNPSLDLFPILHTLFQLVKERFTSKPAFDFQEILNVGLGFQF